MATKRRQDSNRLRRTYPISRNIPNFEGLTSGSGSNLEVKVLIFNNSSSEIYTFNEPYDTVPICVVSAEDENVNLYISSITTTNVTVESSNSFTGKAHLQIHEVDNG